MQIEYRKGDLVNSTHEGIIAHIVNDQGSWGRGFQKSLARRWKLAEEHYRQMHKYRTRDFCLGCVQFVPVSESPKVIVANMICQHKRFTPLNTRPFRLEYWHYCL